MANPVLHRFEATLYQTAPDGAQSPLAGSAVDFYFQGATVSADLTIPAGGRGVVNVHDWGDLRGLNATPYTNFPAVPDRVRAGFGGPELTVVTANAVAAPPPFHGTLLVELANNTGSDVTLLAGTRLIIVNRRPPVFLNPDRTGTSVSSVLSDAGGRAWAYVPHPRYDFTVPALGRLFVDAEGGAQPTPAWLNLRDFPDLQAAVDALPRQVGGEIFIPAGCYTIGATVRITTPNVCLRGEGPQSVLEAASPDLTLVQVQKDPQLMAVPSGFRIRDLTLDGGATTPGAAGIGLLVVGFETSGSYLENVTITRTRKYGLQLVDTRSTLVMRCRVVGNQGTGVHLSGNPTACLMGSTLSDNLGRAVEMAGPAQPANAVALLGCRLAGNLGAQTAAIDISNCARLSVRECSFEHASGVRDRFVRISGAASALVDGCWFDGADLVGRAVSWVGSKGARFSNNCGQDLVAGFAEFDAGCDDCVEFGNREEAGAPRLAFAGKRVFSLGRGAVSIDRYSNATKPNPATVAPGSMIWIDDPGQLALLVSNGTSWVTIGP